MEEVRAKCLPHIGGCSASELVLKLVEIGPPRLANCLERFLTVKLSPLWSRCIEPRERNLGKAIATH